MVITDTFIRWLPRAPSWFGHDHFMLFNQNAWSYGGTPYIRPDTWRRCPGYLRADWRTRWRQ